jgi:cytochrome c oxidase subunit I+III
MHLTGLLGMPRRIDVYPDNPEWVWLNLTSSIFGFVMTIGFALFALDLVLQAWLGPRSPRNPWRAPGLDWAMRLPAPSYNFASLPGPRQLEGVEPAALALARGQGLLPGAPRGWRELLVTGTGDGRPDHVAILPGNSHLPLRLSASIGLFVLMMLAGLYWLTLPALALVAALIWVWGRGMVWPADLKPVEVAPGLTLPFHVHRRATLAYTGAICLLIANGTFFATLLFGVGFLHVVAPGWPAPPAQDADMMAALPVGAVVVALVLGALSVRLADWARRGGRAVLGAAGFGLLVNVLALALIAWLAATAIDDPTRHARDALRGALAGYVGLHALIVAGFAVFALDQWRRGELAPSRAGCLPAWRLWQDYSAVIALVTAAVVLLQGGGG